MKSVEQVLIEWYPNGVYNEEQLWEAIAEANGMDYSEIADGDLAEWIQKISQLLQAYTKMVLEFLHHPLAEVAIKNQIFQKNLLDVMIVLKPNEIYREQEFYCLGEIEEWVRRDYYGNDLKSLINVFLEMRYTANEWLDRAKENGVAIPKHWTEEQRAARHKKVLGGCG